MPNNLQPDAPEGGAMVACFSDGTVEVMMTSLVAGSEAVRASAALLSDAEHRRAEGTACEHQRRRFIVARARLRQLLAVRLGVPPESVALAYGVHGKPALAPRYAASGVRFNVSHCADVAVYAFASGREIGIDVETVRPIAGAGGISMRFFSRREQEAYRALDPRDRPLGFFNCWTRKEAFVKAVGNGLYHPLARIEVSLAPGAPAQILRVGDRSGNRGWRIESFSPAPGLVAAVVTGPARRGAVRELPLTLRTAGAMSRNRAAPRVSAPNCGAP